MVWRICLCLFLCFAAEAQKDSVYVGDQTPAPRPRAAWRDAAWVENVTYGGNFQLWFGNPTFVFLSPTIGYMPVENLNVGIGGIYNYTSITYSFGKYTQSIFGGHSYARYIIGESFFPQIQFDMLKQPDWLSPDEHDRIWIKYLLVGGGFRQSLGDKAALMTSIMYNLTPHPYSIYPGRVIVQFGFVGGL